MNSIYINAYDTILDNTKDFTVLDLDRKWEKEFMPYATTPESKILHSACYGNWSTIGENITDNSSFDSDGFFQAWKAIFLDDDLSYLDYAIYHDGNFSSDTLDFIMWFRGISCETNSVKRKAMASLFWQHAKRFIPARNSIDYWIAPNSHFDITPWILSLCMKWKPDTTWKIVMGDCYSTVISPEKKIIVDPFYFRIMSGSEILDLTRRDEPVCVCHGCRMSRTNETEESLVKSVNAELEAA